MKITAFWRGFLFYAVCNTFLQDLYFGKEAYLAYAESHWIDARFSTPIAFAVLIVLCISHSMDQQRPTRPTFTG